MITLGKYADITCNSSVITKLRLCGEEYTKEAEIRKLPQWYKENISSLKDSL